MARKTCAYLSTRSIREAERREERTQSGRSFIRGFIIKSSSLGGRTEACLMRPDRGVE